MKLLLAEDERSLAKALSTILRKNNYTVETVYDGESALAYLSSEQYDAAILDIMMPRMDGLTVLRKIRSRGNDIPVLFLTAKAEVEDKIEGLDSGANDYLTKPFSTGELLARIRAMTRIKGGSMDNRLKFGNVVLDRTSFELSAPGGVFQLANREYQMMEMLLLNPKHLISTEQFYEKIWGLDNEAETDIVWVYLSYLRKKLKAIGADVEIRSSRNLGYSLEQIV